MKKTALLVMLALMLGSVIAQENIFFDESYLGPTAVIDNRLDVSVGEKILSVDLESFSDFDITVSEEDENPILTINYSNEFITIKQLAQKKTVVMAGKPSENMQSIVYIVEHYSPDLPINNPEREDGKERITVVVKDAEVEVHNKIIARTDGLKIATRSFLEASDTTGKEIDVISGKKGFEIFSDLKYLIINSINFTINNLFDRGFLTLAKNNIDVDLSGMEFTDMLNGSVVPVNTPATSNETNESSACSKFGFRFFPGYGYEFLSETNRFTKSSGWALGIAQAHDDHFEASITDMSNFLIYAYAGNLTPIVRILGNNEMDKVESADYVVSFVKRLKQESNGKLKYIQIWDKPNVDYDTDDYFAYPQNYADYVIEIKNKLSDPGIKIIAGSLSIGETGWQDGHLRNNSIEYLDVLLRIPEFWDAIDYWGSSSYDMEYTDNYCSFGEGTSLIEQESMCLKSIYAYRWELSKIEKTLGNEFPVVITDAGFLLADENMDKLKPLIALLRDDVSVSSAIISSANGQDDSWINRDTFILENFAMQISDSICQP